MTGHNHMLVLSYDSSGLPFVLTVFERPHLSVGRNDSPERKKPPLIPAPGQWNSSHWAEPRGVISELVRKPAELRGKYQCERFAI